MSKLNFYYTQDTIIGDASHIRRTFSQRSTIAHVSKSSLKCSYSNIIWQIHRHFFFLSMSHTAYTKLHTCKIQCLLHLKASDNVSTTQNNFLFRIYLLPLYRQGRVNDRAQVTKLLLEFMRYFDPD